jgi:hypothetical protein
MTNAEQVHPTPVVLTRRDNLKRAAAALVERRKKTSSTKAAGASSARANSLSATTSEPSRPILAPPAGHST